MNNANFLRDTVDLVKQIETRFLELAARLFQIHSRQLWQGTYETYQEFLDTAKVSKGNASMLEAIHETYVVNGGVSHERLARVGYSNLYAAIPLIESKGVEKAVEMARTLTRSELKEEVREDKHGECGHTEIIQICATCHKRIEDH
jgi:hypothetical protein